MEKDNIVEKYKKSVNNPFKSLRSKDNTPKPLLRGNGLNMTQKQKNVALIIYLIIMIILVIIRIKILMKP